MAAARTVLFDFDGTLIDSDAVLQAPFAALGLAEADFPPLGLPLPVACERAGITVADYLAHYDPGAARPFPGVEEALDLVLVALAPRRQGPVHPSGRRGRGHGWKGPLPIWSRTVTTSGLVRLRRCQLAPSTTRVWPEMNRA